MRGTISVVTRVGRKVGVKVEWVLARIKVRVRAKAMFSVLLRYRDGNECLYGYQHNNTLCVWYM